MSATQSRQPFTRNCWPPSARRLASANRNGNRERALTGPTGPVALALPRATLFRGAGVKEWTSTIVPRYQRRMPEVNAAVVATYLAGGTTRRIRGALQPLLKAAPVSKSAVSRVIATLKDGLEAWWTRSLADLDVIYVYLDAFALRVRSAGKVVSAPVLGVVAVLSDGRRHLLAVELCGGESFAAWKGCLDDLVTRGPFPTHSSQRDPESSRPEEIAYGVPSSGGILFCEAPIRLTKGGE